MSKFNYIAMMLLLIPIVVFSQQTKLDKQSYRKIDSLFKSYHSDKTPGSIFRIQQNGEIMYSNQIGLVNLEYQIPITETTLFNIASNSKQFTTYLALFLFEKI